MEHLEQLSHIVGKSVTTPLNSGATLPTSGVSGVTPPISGVSRSIHPTRGVSKSSWVATPHSGVCSDLN